MEINCQQQDIKFLIPNYIDQKMKNFLKKKKIKNEVRNNEEKVYERRKTFLSYHQITFTVELINFIWKDFHFNHLRDGGDGKTFL